MDGVGHPNLEREFDVCDVPQRARILASAEDWVNSGVSF